MIINTQLRKEIEKSIADCEACAEIEEANSLYNELIAKYTVLDPNFEAGLPMRGRLTSFNGEKDCRPVIKAIQEKLKMMLINAESPLSSKIQKIADRIDELISEGNAIHSDYYSDEGNYLISDEIEGSSFDKWILEIEVFSKRNLTTHTLFQRMHPFFGKHSLSPNEFSQILSCLHVIAEDIVFFTEIEEREQSSRTGYLMAVRESSTTSKNCKKVFIVHGHDQAMKHMVARTLEKAGLEAIILHEKPNEGKTIIEKIEQYTDVGFAVILYSPCDIGRAKESTGEQERPRARQNVVFEHGYLIGRLGRERVSAIVSGCVEKPGDIDGVVYIDFDERGAWKAELGKELKNAGLLFDFEKLVC